MYRIKKIDGIISTDDILPAKYKHASLDPDFWASKIFEYKFPGVDFRQYKALVCNDIFGIGSSREQAVSALKYAGIECVIAPGFGRIFYRNAWNNALPTLQLNIFDSINDDEFIELNLEEGFIEQKSTGLRINFPKTDPFMLDIYHHGGIFKYLKTIQNNAAL